MTTEPTEATGDGEQPSQDEIPESGSYETGTITSTASSGGATSPHPTQPFDRLLIDRILFSFHISSFSFCAGSPQGLDAGDPPKAYCKSKFLR